MLFLAITAAASTFLLFSNSAMLLSVASVIHQNIRVMNWKLHTLFNKGMNTFPTLLIIFNQSCPVLGHNTIDIVKKKNISNYKQKCILFFFIFYFFFRA